MDKCSFCNTCGCECGSVSHVSQNKTQFMYNVYYKLNKAIRDGKYLARYMPVLGNVHPINIEHFDILLCDVISLLARVVILLIDKATQEVPMKHILKKLSVQFLRYAIELLYVKRRTCHK